MLFGKLDCTVQMKLMYSYCSSFYGCCLWDILCPEVNAFNVSWRSALKRLWKLPMTTHSDILYCLCGKWPVETELKWRILNFSYGCISSDNYLVKFVTGNALTNTYQSTFARSLMLCCRTFNLKCNDVYSDNRPNKMKSFRILCADKSHTATLLERTQFLFELIMVRDGVFTLDGFLKEDVKHVIYNVCSS